jgi:hypothetical protein
MLNSTILEPGGTSLEGLLEVSQEKRDILKSKEKTTIDVIAVNSNINLFDLRNCIVAPPFI